VLAGGVLAPLPPKVRLPHEEDDPVEDDEGTARALSSTG
jgi:hypothetical protein